MSTSDNKPTTSDASIDRDDQLCTTLASNLVPLVNSLQNAFTSAGITAPVDLPQIVVVGSQSSGKSSVLENLVGRDFLPRGTGIVTRRPLVLQLINTKGNETYGEFLHKPGEKFHDFSLIREEIERDTQLKAGDTKGISPLPINLSIYSPSVVTLTLVDLPGLTKVPVGDQPRNIEQQIRDINLKYISNKNAIVLAVTAANTDLANSDALKIAREIDPEGFRTLGVLTKIDLMDKGTDVIDILTGKVIPLHLGYIPVINRGQRDIERNTKIADALKNEREFFENHQSYSSKAKYCGTEYLSKKLNSALTKHIKKTLPDIKSKITQILSKNRRELDSIGHETSGQSQNIFLSIVSEFCSDFRQILDGTLQNGGLPNMAKNELWGGARISFIFHETFSNAIASIEALDEIKEQEIRTLIYNSSGSTPSLLLSTPAFEVLVKQKVNILEKPSLDCAKLIYDELVKILVQLLQKNSFKRFPLLKEKLYHQVIEIYDEGLKQAKGMIEDIINSESGYVNTGHPDFIGGPKAMASANEKITAAQPSSKAGSKQSAGTTGNKPSNIFGTFISGNKGDGKTAKPGTLETPPTILRPVSNLSEREMVEIEMIKILIESYFNITKKTISDLVPKAIMLKLVGMAKTTMQQELLKGMYAERDDLEKLLSESDIIVDRRKELKRLIEALVKAERLISNY